MKDLYPESERQDKEKAHNSETAKTIRGDPHMWSIVEKAMGEGTLEALRNSDGLETVSMASRPLLHSLMVNKEQRQKQKRDSKRKRKTGQSGILKDMLGHTMAGVDEGGESDGGFFE